MINPILDWTWTSSARPVAGSRRIGLWSISANPPHRSHVVIAQEALEKDRLNAIVVILSREHVSKSPDGASFEQRLAMMQQAFTGIPNLFIVTTQSGRYLHHTQSLRKQFPLAVPILLVGADNLRQMTEFNTPQELALFASLRAEISVHPRDGDETSLRILWLTHPDQWPKTFTDRVHFRSTQAEPMSSSAIREMIVQNNPAWVEKVAPSVADTIRRLSPYRQQIDLHRG